MLEAIALGKTLVSDGQPSQILKSVSLTVRQGDFTTVVGRSGSGKSTLLNCLSTLLTPDAGAILYEGRDLTTLSGAALDRLRRTDFAVVFQMHYLIPYLTALENALLPFMQTFAPVGRDQIARAERSLERVGLAGKRDRLPGQLSGGEQQRVAIARALVKRSRILFADEPTGSLDKQTGQSIMSLLKELNAEGLTIVMVTHDPDYVSYADCVVEIEDGRIRDSAGNDRPAPRLASLGH